MPQRLPIGRLSGQNTRNDPEQTDPGRAISARNVVLGRQTARSRQGYVKATVEPVWGRSLELRGIRTGIIGTRLPEGLDPLWDDTGGVSDHNTVTFQIRTQPINLDQSGDTEIPYSLDNEGFHRRPVMKEVSNPGLFTDGPPNIATDEAQGTESGDALLWKPTAAANRYDTTGSKVYPWLPGIADVSVVESQSIKPRMLCIFGTGPLREYPPTWADCAQYNHITNFHDPIPGDAWETLDQWDRRPPDQDSNAVTLGDVDAGDYYLFWVFSPITSEWYLLWLWEYGDPGSDAIPHQNAMNRMFVFAGWGDAGDNLAAAPIDPSVPHTITVQMDRVFLGSVPSVMTIVVDDPQDGTHAGVEKNFYGVESSEPFPGGGPAAGPTNASSAPILALAQLSGNGSTRVANRGRTFYIGGLPKASNQRGVWGLGCGQSVSRGGMQGVTCAYPGRVSEFRLYAGVFDISQGVGRDYRAASVLGAHDSRTVKRLQGDVAWDFTTTPLSTPYQGCVNIWRLDEEDGDIFDPLYTFGGTGIAESFWTSGKPAGLLQDFHPFESLSNGALIAPGKLQASSGGMRFNGATPAFTLRGAIFRKSSGVVQTSSDRASTINDVLEKFDHVLPPTQFSWGCIYTVETAPELEPSSGVGFGGIVPYPALTKPHQGEVHTLMQMASPNRQGKTDSVIPNDFFLRTIAFGLTEGIAEGYDHPDTFWEDSTDSNVTGGGGEAPFLPQGHKDLELARIDLVCHLVDVDGAGDLQRRYAIRSDFGYGATFDDYLDLQDADLARQQKANSQFFRSNFNLATPAANIPFDVDDDYQAHAPAHIGTQGDDRYCYLYLGDAAGNPYDKPDDLEGRSFGIVASYTINPQQKGGGVTEVGTQTLTVYDITVPGAVFEVGVLAAATEKRLTAECGITQPITDLHGKQKVWLTLGGKFTPQYSDWWVGHIFDDYHPPGQSEHYYPYGSWAISNTSDQREDPFAVSSCTQQRCNGAKGTMDIAIVFRQNVSKGTAQRFFASLAQETSPWMGRIPPAAREIIEDNALSVWLSDTDSGPVVTDDIGGLHLGLDERLPAIHTHGGPQYPLDPNGGQTVKERNSPFTYNNNVFASMFPDNFLPVRQINTGRRDTLYAAREYSSVVTTAAVSQGETNNVQPSEETLLAVVQHLRNGATTDILCVSKTSVFRYDDTGDGTLVRIASLPKHFSASHVVSRDSFAERLVMTNGAAFPVIVDAQGVPRNSHFIAAPTYGIPVIWARTWKGGTVLGVPVTLEDVPDPAEWPFVFQIADPTVLPRSNGIIGIQRIEAAQGLIWTGEMPRLIEGAPSAPWGASLKGLVTSPPDDIIIWRFFFTYYSEKLNAESRPGRVFTWSNVLPLRAPGPQDLGSPQGAFVTPTDDQFTGEPNTKGHVLVMEGLKPVNVEDVLGDGEGIAQQPIAYNLKIRHVPVSPNPDVTHLRVYRTIANGSEFFLESEIAIAAGEETKDASVTVLVGTRPDEDLSNTFISGLGSVVPNGARFTASYQGRMFYAGFAYNPSRIYWSYKGRPGSVPFFYYEDLVGLDTAPITALYVDKDRLWAHKEDGIFIATVREFDIYTFDQVGVGLPCRFELSAAKAGAVGDRALASVPDRGIIFAGDTSVWAGQGIQLTRVSSPIDGESQADSIIPGPTDARTAEARLVYPYSLDNTQRDRWRALYYPQRRHVLIFGGPNDPTLVLHTDLMEWSWFDNYNFDDSTVVSRVNSEVSEMWAVRDSRLWKLDVGEADGIDYLGPNLTGNFMIDTSGALTRGAIAFTSDPLEILTDLFVVDLPAAYQALLATDETKVRALDFLRSVRVRVKSADGLTIRGESKIAHAFKDGGGVLNLRLETPISGMVGTDIWEIGEISSHWISSSIQPGDGREECEVLHMDFRKVDVFLDKTAHGSAHDLRGTMDLYLAFNKTVFEASDLVHSFPGGTAAAPIGERAKKQASHKGIRGRGDSFIMGWFKNGAYAPVEAIDASVLTELLTNLGWQED